MLNSENKSPVNRYKILHVFSRIFIYLLIIVFLTFALFPIFWMISTSLKPNADTYDFPPTWIPKKINFESYIAQLAPRDIGSSHLRPSGGLPRYFKNGMIVSVSVTIFTILLSIFAGYGFSRFSFPGKRRLFIFILATQMFPAVLIIVQLYILFHNLKIINTYYGLILALTALSLPLSIWMLRGFFDRIPRELEEAAWVDGCSVMGALYRIIVPIISPGIIAVALFSFLVAWNNLLFTLTLSIRPEMYTIPPGFLSDYVGQFTYYWAEMSAGAVMVSIPVIIIFILLQKYLVQGLTAGAVKG